MKRKVVNPDIQQKKRQQLLSKELSKDLKYELENEQITHPPKSLQKSPQTRHK